METALVGKTAKINGYRIYFEENESFEKKPAIVLLHGFLSSSFSFRMLVPYLTDDYHVISVDMPPFGKSDKSKKYIYSYKNIAQTVLQLADSLGIERFSLIGHSMGGQIAMNIMLQEPEKIERGILLAGSSYYKRARKHHILASYIPFFSYFIKYYLSKTGVVGNLKSVVYNQSLIDGAMIRGYREQFEDTRIFSALAHMIRDREGDLPGELLRQIKTPCLLIWGEHDRIVPVQIGERLVQDLQNSRLVVLKNAGHLLPEEKPKEVYEQIRKFLNT